MSNYQAPLVTIELQEYESLKKKEDMVDIITNILSTSKDGREIEEKIDKYAIKAHIGNVEFTVKLKLETSSQPTFKSF